MKKINKRGFCFLMAIVIMATTILIPAPAANAATSSKIKIYNFIKLVVQATDLEVDTTKTSPYLSAALAGGIVKDGDFSDYTKYITRTDAAVILNRADEYLHGDTVDADLLETVLEGRISDISKVASSKREAVAKIYAKGFMKGYSNGYYIKSREFRGSEYLTTTGAKGVVSMLTNTSKRAKLSSDGQLIRTTNLPSNASKYEYILATYPNSFYEMKFSYNFTTYYYQPVEGKDYSSPAYLSSVIDSLETSENNKYVYMNDWIDKIELNLQTRLNVDYSTVDTVWLNNLRSTYFVFNNTELDKDTTDDIKEYIQIVKKNKVIIKSSVITVEPSTMYKDKGFYYVRCYVKFKVSFSGDTMAQDDLFYGGTMKLYNLKRNTWFTGIYDIGVATQNGSSDGSDYAVSEDSLNDYFYKGENN